MQKVLNWLCKNCVILLRILDVHWRMLNGLLLHFLKSDGSYVYSVTSRPGVHHIPGPLHHRSTILSALGPDYALTVLFLGTHTRTSQWVTHHGSALARYSLNFEVPTKPEASELPKGLVLGRDVNTHIRITPLGDVGSHNPPPLGARRPRRHTTARVRLWYQSDQNYTTAQPIILKPMGSQRELSRLWKICWDRQFCSLAMLGISAYRW